MALQRLASLWTPSSSTCYSPSNSSELHPEQKAKDLQVPLDTPNAVPSATFAHLVCFVEEQAEVGEDDPQFLPAVAVLELPQQVSRELVLAQNKKKKKTTNLPWNYRLLSFRKNRQLLQVKSLKLPAITAPALAPVL